MSTSVDSNSMVDTSMVDKILASGTTFGDIGDIADIRDLMNYNYWTLNGVYLPMYDSSFDKRDVFQLIDEGLIVHGSEKEMLIPGVLGLLFNETR